MIRSREYYIKLDPKLFSQKARADIHILLAEMKNDLLELYKLLEQRKDA
jgi:hypothetical protein